MCKTKSSLIGSIVILIVSVSVMMLSGIGSAADGSMSVSAVMGDVINITVPAGDSFTNFGSGDIGNYNAKQLSDLVFQASDGWILTVSGSDSGYMKRTTAPTSTLTSPLLINTSSTVSGGHISGHSNITLSGGGVQIYTNATDGTDDDGVNLPIIVNQTICWDDLSEEYGITLTFMGSIA